VNALRGQRGLTLFEVLLALVVIAVVTVAFTTAVVKSMHHTSIAGKRTEAVQVLNYLGRRAAGGDSTILPVSGTPNTWAYGDLATAFTDLANQGGLSSPAMYRASITNVGDVTVQDGSGNTLATATEYDVNVCYQDGGAEHCVDAATLGPQASGSTTAPPLPGIN